MQELLRTGIYFGKLEVNSPTLPSRAAAQTSLHKMYTFVYRTFIKFILFCRGQALDVHGLELLLLKRSTHGIWSCFNALTGLSCYIAIVEYERSVDSFNALTGLSCYRMQLCLVAQTVKFQCPHGLELLLCDSIAVIIPDLFQCPHGLELLRKSTFYKGVVMGVSMPSRAWVVTARMSNILNSSWYFLCIPAIYKCILAYLPIFFNQLSKFLRCESPSTFLGTCLSHHSFIIFLVTNTNTLLSGLYLISTYNNCEKYQYHNPVCQCPLGLELLR